MTILLAALGLALCAAGTFAARSGKEALELTAVVLWVAGFCVTCASLANLLPEQPLCIQGHEEYRHTSMIVGRTPMTVTERVWVCDQIGAVR